MTHVSVSHLLSKRTVASSHIPARLQHRIPVLKCISDLAILMILLLLLWVSSELGRLALVCLLAPLGIYMAGGYGQNSTISRSELIPVFAGTVVVIFIFSLIFSLNLLSSLILAFLAGGAFLGSRLLLQATKFLNTNKPNIFIPATERLNPYLLKSLEKALGTRATLVLGGRPEGGDSNDLQLAYSSESPNSETSLFSDFYSRMTGRAVFISDGPFANTVNTELRATSAAYHVSKRLLDIVLSGIPVLLFMPLFILIYVAIRIDSKGSPIFVQEREGQGGSVLQIKKFRSMVHSNAGPNEKELWTSKNDARLTGVGKMIRKFRLDELPQLITILEGTMSFVGPRPQRKFLNDMIPDLLSAEKDLRLKIRPGLTGWAQVNGGYFGSSHDPEEKRGFEIEKLRYDVYYAQHRSFLMDFKIFLLTFKTVLGRKGH